MSVDLKTEDFYDIAFGDHPKYETVIDEHVVETSRWSKFMSMVTKDTVTGKLYEVTWEVGATEYQECEPDFEMVEVYPKEVTTTVYTNKKD